jgi:hypothetical protein
MTTHTPSVVSTFRLGPDIVAAMRALQVRDGIPPSEQARRALAAWLEKRGVYKPERPRGKRAKKGGA